MDPFSFFTNLGKNITAINAAVSNPDIDLIPGIGGNESTRQYERQVSSQDPNKVSYALDGENYNFAGDRLGRAQAGANDLNFDFGTIGGGTGGSGSGGYSAEDVAYIDDLIANYNRQMGRTTSGLDTGLSQLESSFNKETSRQNEARGRALEDFSTRRSDTDRAKQSAIGKVDTNARTLADSLRRRLGMAGGTDSSAFKFAAPNAVAREASGERADVLTNYGQNYRDLATSENRAKTDFENLLADLAEQKRSRETSLRSGVLEQQNQISEALANAAREKATIMGGGYGAARNASSRFTNDIASRESQIDQLLSQGVTPYSVKDVQVNAPSLRDYTVDRAAINANQGTSSTYSPYEQLLKRRNEDQTLA